MDFSASTNPFTPQFVWSPESVDLSYYPDDSYSALKERIGTIFKRDPSEICVGNGSVELIRVFCSVVFHDTANAGSFSAAMPTFGEYDLSARLAGARPAGPGEKADVEFHCNPNNPTGTLTPRRDVLSRLQSFRGTGRILFCDEAFIELSDPRESVADISDPGLFVLRSLTKCFSVPGIRFGYGFGDADLIEKIETARPPWTVNAFAESYAMEAFLHMGDLEFSRSAIERERCWLCDHFSALGFSCHPSSVNYLLVDCGFTVSSLCERLEQKDILVRNCTSFGLPSCIRVAVRTHEENTRLIEVMTSCMH